MSDVADDEEKRGRTNSDVNMEETNAHSFGHSPQIAGSLDKEKEDAAGGTPVTQTAKQTSETEGSEDSEGMETDDGELLEETFIGIMPKSKSVESKTGRKKRKVDDRSPEEKETFLLGKVTTPALNPDLSKYLERVERLCSESITLLDLVEKNNKTKLVIKEKARCMARLAKKVRKLKENVDFQSPIKGIDMINAPESPILPEPFRKLGNQGEEDVEVEKELPPGIVYCGKCQMEIGRELRLVKEIREEMKELEELDENKDRLASLIRKEWPDGAYKVTETRTGNITKEATGNLKIVILSEDEATNIQDGHNWIDRMTGHPGIIKKIQGRFYQPFMCRKYSTLTALGRNDLDEPETSKIFVLLTHSKEVDLVELFKALRSIREEAKVKECVNVATVGKVCHREVRKVMECAFVGTESRAIIMIPGSRSPTETLIVKSKEGKSFAELVKGVKEAVNLDALDVNIKALRRNKDGSMMLLTDGQNTERLRDAIRDRVEGTSTTLGGMKTVEILDLDPTVSRADIIEELMKLASQDERERITVENPRETTSGFQIANVTAPRSLSDKLIKSGAIRIGWTSCRLKEHIRIDRCINCLQLGHIAIKCKEQKTPDIRCLKCTGIGHKAKDCVHEAYCVVCKTIGHRNDSFICPSYRELVQKMRTHNQQ